MVRWNWCLSLQTSNIWLDIFDYASQQTFWVLPPSPWSLATQLLNRTLFQTFERVDPEYLSTIIIPSGFFPRGYWSICSLHFEQVTKFFWERQVWCMLNCCCVFSTAAAAVLNGGFGTNFTLTFFPGQAPRADWRSGTFCSHVEN